MEKIKIIIITGATGSGKTDISLKIAQEFNGEIINADASQMKKELNIGTAKINLAKTNIKHHLIDFLEPTSSYSIKDFQENARALISDISKRGKLPIIVGGTGLYINALLYDYNLSSSERDPEFEEKYNHLSNHELHKCLEEKNPEVSKNIHENNRRRVLRALEKTFNQEYTIDDANTKDMLYDALIFSLNWEREVLYERINKRVDLMIMDGWIKECQNLVNKHYEIEKIKDIGYQEIFAYLRNEITFERMNELIKQKTRNYAKRQITWFKNKLPCQIIDMDYENIKDINLTIINKIKDFLC